ncbi:uncharacterized protein LOC115985692 [Quercus lobata]|uniref:uncharacterized protein LOC115985692 n=1 Tax=Quercus lobata TaxID=97700 RepID=UPI0012481E4D|nr:uncharacterized protein LOC115985692 [Quercus lobata]
MPKKAKYTHNIPRYEMARLYRMRQNQEIIDALGLKHISTSLKDSAQSNCAKGKRSRTNIVVDDDYVPPIGDDDNDDESSNSVIHKMAPGRLTCSRGEASIPVVQSTETPLEANPPAQSSSSAEALTNTTGSTSRTTRGITVQTFVEKSGKLPIRIATEYNAPVGKNVCKLINQIAV